jgi:hypothetical protein
MPGLALLDAPDRFALKSRWVRGARRCGASGTMTATTFRLLGVGAGEFTGATVEGSFARTPSFSGVDGRGAVLEPLRDVSPARLTKVADIVHSQPRPRELVADHFQARKPRYRDGEERAHHTSLVRRRVIVRLRPTGCALNLVFGPGVHRGQARRARAGGVLPSCNEGVAQPMRSASFYRLMTMKSWRLAPNRPSSLVSSESWGNDWRLSSEGSN